jgi:hypothetical protein
MDILVKELKAMDRVAISTRNSEYQFQVINPAQCRGILRGGACGEEQYEAVLTGTVAQDQPSRVSNKLETGMCALFYINAKESAKLLTTSVITRLILAR